MNKDSFWALVQKVHDEADGSMERKCVLLHQQLAAFPSAELEDFIACFDEADAAAYTWSLWGAAYILHGGCSEDDFADFRATLISMGRAVYAAALDDPETLARVRFDEGGPCFEGYAYVLQEVAEQSLGKVPHRRTSFPDEPAGEPWNEEEVRHLYPALADHSPAPALEKTPASGIKRWWEIYRD